ncbi:hypothetical protein MSP8886_01813 [Marinomonas spartinae]|uniref:Ig-like domain-containing protein n=1 Tax=Marinomonas spartinae TaxID=1792290 RepID=A0A1A8TF03_9GAMM|nr:hypothetical protein [Marinomonas spartinae]SBS30436.1 hypothetical protein MSP8886_01813 [Marinomonas spartinae]
MDYPKRDDLPNGRFTDGDPAHNILASRDSAEQMNAVYDELRALIMAGGIAPDSEDLKQVSKSVGHQLRSKGLFDVSGSKNEIVLTTPAGKQPVTALNDYDEFSFIVTATNTDVITVVIDELVPRSISNVMAGKLIAGNIATIRHISGVFYLIKQADPQSTNVVGGFVGSDVVEYGENAAGAYIKLAGGLVLMFSVGFASGIANSITSGVLYGSDLFTYTYPYQCNTPPYVSITSIDNGNNSFVSHGSPTKSYITCRVFSGNNSNAFSLSAFAIGWWS